MNSTQPKPRILILHDPSVEHPYSELVMKGFSKECGYSVRCASDKGEAFREIMDGQTRVDIVISLLELRQREKILPGTFYAVPFFEEVMKPSYENPSFIFCPPVDTEGFDELTKCLNICDFDYINPFPAATEAIVTYLKAKVQRILESKKSREQMLEIGFRNDEDVTVMFADIAGYSKASNQPGILAIKLNEVLVLATEIIADRYHGFVERYVGDQIKAIFDKFRDNRTPVDTLASALRAARDIRQTLLEKKILFQRINSDEGSAALMNIGICYGPASSALFGLRRPKQQSTIGDVVITASRLQTVAKNGQILLDKRSYEQFKNELVKTRRLENCVDWEDGRETIKGEDFEFKIVE